MPERPWRVVTWNVRGSHGPDVTAIAEVLAGYAPDAVALQEVQHRQARAIAGALGWRWRWARKHAPWTPLVWWRIEGHAILSPHALGPATRRSIAPGVSWWTFRHRIVLAATVEREGERLRVYDTHLASGPAPDERIAQARRVADLVRTEAPALAVVAGDLNTSDELEVFRELRAVGLVDPGGGPTNPAIAPRRRIDHVLVPETARVVDRHEPDGGEPWAELSDHLPALVAFEAVSGGDG